MRIGIYSGTFDPIHEGHVLFVDVVSEQFGIDRVLLIPEPEPRYKNNVTPVMQRLRMAELGVQSADADVRALLLPETKNHTIKGVLRQVYELFPEDEYFILMGGDVFKHVGKWGERDDEEGSIKDIADSVAFVVGIDNMAQLPELQKIADELNLNVRFIEVPIAGLSSRKIRQSIADGKPATGLSDSVQRFIEGEKLYR